MSHVMTPGRILTASVIPLATAGVLLLVAAVEQAAFAWRLWRNVHHPFRSLATKENQ